MNRLLFAVAALPMLVATSAMAQTVSDDVSKQLWCGTAFVAAFSNAPPDATADQLAVAKLYVEGGNTLIGTATQAHLDAGFTEEQVTKLKADLVAEITPIVSGTGDPSKAKYTFDECLSQMPGGAPGASSAAPDASSAAPAPSSSSAM